MADDDRRPRATATAAAPGPDAANDAASEDASHPAPARARVPLAALWFGLFGAPAAWTVQTLVNFPLAAHGCYPRLYPLAAPVVGGLRGIAFAVGLAATAVCVAALATSSRTWRRTRDEQQEGSGRGREHDAGSAALETGEGRTRFMALAGAITSAIFLLASLAGLATVFLVRPCGG